MEAGGLITRPVQPSHGLVLGSLTDPRQGDQELHESNFCYQTAPCLALSRGAQSVPYTWKDYTMASKMGCYGTHKGSSFQQWNGINSSFFHSCYSHIVAEDKDLGPKPIGRRHSNSKPSLTETTLWSTVVSLPAPYILRIGLF